MNPKDAGFLLKNLEKLVMGVAVLLLLVTAYVFVLGNPFPVEVGNREIGPGEIESKITRDADRLDGLLESPETVLPDREPPAYSEAFVKDMAAKPTTLATLAPLAEAGLSKDIIPTVVGLPVYDLPRPPVAEGLLTRKGHTVLNDNIPTREMEGLIKLIGNNEPRDFRYVSVAATFDMDEWVERLQSGDKADRVPARWWNSMIGVAGVMLQRQELNEETGEWGNEVLIDPLPGQLAFKPSVEFKATTQQVKQAIQAVRAGQEGIARPDFPMTKGNILWSPPNEDAQELDAEGQRKLSRINGKIARLIEQIETLEEQIFKAREAESREQRPGQTGRTPTRQPRQRTTRGGGGYGEGGGGYEGGGYGEAGGRAARRTQGAQRGDTARQAEAPATPQDRMKLYQDQLIEAKIERNELLGIEDDVLIRGGHRGTPGGYGEGGGGYEGGGYGGYGGEYPGGGGYGGYGGGYDPYGGAGGYGTGGYGQAPGGYGGGVAQPEQVQEESRKIRVWAHDLSIESGKTYRYRVVVAVLNPLYRQKRVADEQRAEHYDRIALGPDPEELAASPWSDPVRVDSEYYFFMVKGSAQTQIARVEVWRVYDGRWHSHVFEVRPGDPIGKRVQAVSGSRAYELDMNVGLVVVDLVQAAASGSFGSADVRMLYLDPEGNQIADRSIEEDRNSADWIRLRNEQALEAELELTTGPAGEPVTRRN